VFIVCFENLSAFPRGRSQTMTELHKRESDGLTVTLFAEFEGADVEISCRVQDVKTGDDFTIRDIPHHKALEVFKHPLSVGVSLLSSGKLAV